MKASRLKIIDQVSDERPIPQRWGHIGLTGRLALQIPGFSHLEGLFFY